MSPNTILPPMRRAPLKHTVKRWFRFNQQTVMVIALTGFFAIAAVAATVSVIATVGVRIPASLSTTPSLTTIMR